MQLEWLFGPKQPARADDQWLVVGAQRVRLCFARHRRARRYVLRLRPDGTARVTVPRGGSIAEAMQFAERNARWLEHQLLKHALRPKGPGAWTIGTEILFRGERVRILTNNGSPPDETSPATDVRPLTPSLSPSDGERVPFRAGDGEAGVQSGFVSSSALAMEDRNGAKSASVRLGSEIVPIPDAVIDLRPVLEQHLRRLAAKELPVRVFELAALHQLPVRRVTVRNQRSRWGSCSRHGTISLNWRLVQTPVFVRDYIVLHELAHLKEMNHSRRFWREVAALCPGYREAEAWLKAHSGLLS